MKLMRTLGPLFFAVLFGVSGVRAQNIFRETDILAKDRPEAWAMKLVGSELLMPELGVARKTKPWSIQAGFDAGWIPRLNAEQRLIGFNGTKEENLNRTPLLGRPRVEIGLPGQFSAGFGYIPPLLISGIRPNVFTWSLARPIVSHSWWRLGGRIQGQVGHIRGDITCDKATVDAGSDPIRNPFRCEARSDDQIRIRSVGLELGSAFAVTPRLEPYVATGWNYFDNEFHVNSRYSGLLDQSVLLTNGPTFSLNAGINYLLGTKIRIGAETFYTPLDVRRLGERTSDSLVNVRAGVFYLIR